MNKTAVITIDSDTFVEEVSSFYNEEDRKKILELTYRIAIGRIFEIMEIYKIKTTFFLISSHLKYERCVIEMKNLISKEHEISDHSYAHNRNILSLSEKEIEKELEKSKKIINEKLNIFPLGFRSPGAELNENLINALKNKGYLYDSSLNSSFIYSVFKKIYFKFKKENFKKTDIKTNLSIPHRIKSIYEFPLSESSFFTIPLFNFFMMPLGNKGLKIIQKTSQKTDYINYVIHLHEFISTKEINSIKIKKGLMNIFDTDIDKKILFLKNAIKIIKNNFEIIKLKDFCYNLSYTEKK